MKAKNNQLPVITQTCDSRECNKGIKNNQTLNSRPHYIDRSKKRLICVYCKKISSYS